MCVGTSSEPWPWFLAFDAFDPKEWTPRELRRSFVSVLSDAGVPLDAISQLAEPPSQNSSMGFSCDR
jgi:hypothetical protein